MIKKYILASLNIIIFFISLIIYIIGLLYIKPFTSLKSIIIIISLTAIFISSIILYFNKKIKLYNIGIFITFLLNIIIIYNIIDLNIKYSYINNLFTNKYEYIEYTIYVQKKNVIYSDISKLNNKKIGTISNNKNINAYLNDIINIECINYDNIDDLTYAIENGIVQSVILNKKEYESIPDNKAIKHKTRDIYTSKIKYNK